MRVRLRARLQTPLNPSPTPASSLAVVRARARTRHRRHIANNLSPLPQRVEQDKGVQRLGRDARAIPLGGGHEQAHAVLLDGAPKAGPVARAGEHAQGAV